MSLGIPFSVKGISITLIWRLQVLLKSVVLHLYLPVLGRFPKSKGKHVKCEKTKIKLRKNANQLQYLKKKCCFNTKIAYVLVAETRLTYPENIFIL